MATTKTRTSDDLDDLTREAATSNIEPSRSAMYDDDDAETILPEYDDLLEEGDYYSIGTVQVAKEELVGVPFVIYDYSFHQGKLLVDSTDASVTMKYVEGGIKDRDTKEIVAEGNRLEFVVVRAVTAPGSKRRPPDESESEHVVFADGSTGIYEHLRKLYNARGVVKIRCKRGLRVSEYEGPHGGPSKTFYLA